MTQSILVFLLCFLSVVLLHLHYTAFSQVHISSEAVSYSTN